MCSTFGECSNLLGNTCGCINALPPNNTYCQPLSDLNPCPTTAPTTTPPVFRQYLLSIELKTTTVAAVERLRNISYPIISSNLHISDVNISTVCSPYNTSHQCRCEDQYGWPCDMCSTFGECSNLLGNTCGCINALPPNNTYCQSLSV
ncbi:adhesion G protein-coupled receptor F5-like [Cyprinodon tularosa]|uniref:adhesion G protein-coupled receptor F5-like n=1 Tax=Cyprinodon tularosa TaxID=77115 RepID=UPI0018E28A30|nr:adhesion G protein-coupled receptor F5-like [Cyprinodon tularosa]